MGLGRYYQQRLLDPAARAPKPEAHYRVDLARYVRSLPDGTHELSLMVDGIQCGACVWLIEAVLAKQPDLVDGRVNMTTRRLWLRWRGSSDLGTALVEVVEHLGYRLAPFDPIRLKAASDLTCDRLTRSLAVAGFAAGNLMLISIGIWAGFSQGMGSATRALMHWVSAAIALPAIAYAGLPFYSSAWNALRHLRSNMDVPISVGVILVTAMSLSETIRGGPHTYFDSASTLLFFLLVGRVLDHRARGRARQAAEQLPALRVSDVTVVGEDERHTVKSQDEVRPGERVLVGIGERVGVDGTVETGNSTLDASLVTGESLPLVVAHGAKVFAGSVNLTAPLTITAAASGEGTLLAECVRLIEAAEQGRGRFVILADRVARYYAPVVHLTALATFLVWWGLIGISAHEALLNAVSVLIITCPCALALAIPAVQVIAAGRLFRGGILLKSPTALERLASVDTIVFDKTGTLSLPSLQLLRDPTQPNDVLALAAGLASASRHPLARSLAAAIPCRLPVGAIAEVPGQGVSLVTEGGETRLGSAAFCTVETDAVTGGPELFLRRPGLPAERFVFAETLRTDAAEVVAGLHKRGFDVGLLSGDRIPLVVTAAAETGIRQWQAELSPVGKVEALRDLAEQGHRVLMVGDGLNDGPALSEASVSLSPSSAADLSQTVADVVFQGACLEPVLRLLDVAMAARRWQWLASSHPGSRQRPCHSRRFWSFSTVSGLAGWDRHDRYRVSSRRQSLSRCYRARLLPVVTPAWPVRRSRWCREPYPVRR
jgi:Cu2+-exporting ATPase